MIPHSTASINFTGIGPALSLSRTWNASFFCTPIPKGTKKTSIVSSREKFLAMTLAVGYFSKSQNRFEKRNYERRRWCLTKTLIDKLDHNDDPISENKKFLCRISMQAKKKLMKVHSFSDFAFYRSSTLEHAVTSGSDILFNAWLVLIGENLRECMLEEVHRTYVIICKTNRLFYHYICILGVHLQRYWVLSSSMPIA